MRAGIRQQLCDQQVSADGQVEQGGGDVDRVDPLVDERAHRAGTDAVQHPELALAGSDRVELGNGGRLEAGTGVTADRRRAAHRARAPSTSSGGDPERERLSGERAIQRPHLSQVLVHGNRTGGEADDGDDHITGRPRLVVEERARRVVGATAVEGAGPGVSGAPAAQSTR